MGTVFPEAHAIRSENKPRVENSSHIQTLPIYQTGSLQHSLFLLLKNGAVRAPQCHFVQAAVSSPGSTASPTLVTDPVSGRRRQWKPAATKSGAATTRPCRGHPGPLSVRRTLSSGLREHALPAMDKLDCCFSDSGSRASSIAWGLVGSAGSWAWLLDLLTQQLWGGSPAVSVRTGPPGPADAQSNGEPRAASCCMLFMKALQI